MKMPFGKYQGFPVEIIAEYAPAYLTWLLEKTELREPLLSAVQEAAARVYSQPTRQITERERQAEITRKVRQEERDRPKYIEGRPGPKQPEWVDDALAGSISNDDIPY